LLSFSFQKYTPHNIVMDFSYIIRFLCVSSREKGAPGFGNALDIGDVN